MSVLTSDCPGRLQFVTTTTILNFPLCPLKGHREPKRDWSRKNLQDPSKWYLLTASSILGLNLDRNFAVNIPAAASTAASSSLKSKTTRSFCEEPLIAGPGCTPRYRPIQVRRHQSSVSQVDLGDQPEEIASYRNELLGRPIRQWAVSVKKALI